VPPEISHRGEDRPLVERPALHDPQVAEALVLHGEQHRSKSRLLRSQVMPAGHRRGHGLDETVEVLLVDATVLGLQLARLVVGSDQRGVRPVPRERPGEPSGEILPGGLVEVAEGPEQLHGFVGEDTNQLLKRLELAAEVEVERRTAGARARNDVVDRRVGVTTIFERGLGSLEQARAHHLLLALVGLLHGAGPTMPRRV
jgi:hypothetical protein